MYESYRAYYILVAIFLFCITCSHAVSDKGQCNIGKSRDELRASLPRGVSCLECEAAVDVTRLLVKNSPESTIDEVIYFFCDKLKIEDSNVCKGVVVEFKDFFFYMMTHEVAPKTVCGILSYCPKPVYPTWNVTFPTPQPPIKPYPIVAPGGPRIYFLHYSDVHVDLQYTPGLQTHCGEPLCCRPPNAAGTPGNSAGLWGDYNCDLPQRTYESMLSFIADNLPEIDYAIFTGDMPPHDIWLETRETSLTADAYELSLFHKMLPNITVFPAMGNHEAVPVNEFAPRSIDDADFDMGWLYNNISSLWSTWLPSNATEQVKKAGYYTTLTRDGTRIVSLNTNLGCNSENWWLSLPTADSADPDGQLQWFAQI